MHALVPQSQKKSLKANQASKVELAIICISCTNESSNAQRTNDGTKCLKSKS